MTTARTRRVRLAVGRASGAAKLAAWEGLRTDFHYKADRSTRPNNLEVELYNLSPQSRELLTTSDTEPLLMTLFAGAGSSEPPVVAIADVASVQHERIGPDYLTTIEGGEGERIYSSSHVSLSFPPGAMVDQVLSTVTQVYAAGGVTLDPSRLDALPVVQRLRGVSYEGPAARALDVLTRELGVAASVQKGQLVLSQADPKPDSLRATLLTPKTGLVGSPRAVASRSREGKQRWVLRALLGLSIQPGDLVSVESETWTGIGVVDELDARGSTHTDDWHADLTVTPIEPAE